jgi:hypothetical protein
VNNATSTTATIAATTMPTQQTNAKRDVQKRPHATDVIDDTFFDRLINESAAGPSNRDDLDVSAIGDNSNLWVDMCQAFKNDGYPIQAIPLLIQFLLAKDQ